MSEHRRTPNHVVILGGGITGLSAALYFARKHPTVPVTLLEKSTRFGGWVHSERVEVTDNDGNRGSVLLEAGPRTIRPNAKCILELIHLLDLRSEVIYTPRASPAARNRFLHVPPAEGLQPLPYSLLSLLTLPLGRLVLRSVLAEPFVPANRPSKSKPIPTSTPPDSPTTTAIATTAGEGEAGPVEEEEGDESVDSFLSRRFGDAFARTLGSALVHGIYAADSRLLSVRAAFPVLRASEARGNGSVVWGERGPSAWFGRGQAKDKEHGDGDAETESSSGVVVVDREWEKRLVANAALFSFKDGMETLVRALVKTLRGFPNVTLRSGTAVRRIVQTTAVDEDENGFSFQIYLDVKKDSVGGDADAEAAAPLRATHVISALPLPVLDSILQPASAPAAEVGASTTPHNNSPLLPHLRANPHSSVTVLNLVFPNPENSTLHPPGFGYLIPRPEHGYPPSSSAPGPEPEADSEAESGPRPGPGLLGVVFDTASLPEQDDDENGKGVRFTKMTAMLGGPYPHETSSSSNASDAQLVAAVLRLISAHLGRALPPPVHYAVHRNEESIPTYLVDHTARMGELGQALRELWGGRMKVVGAGVGGVSVADCVKAGRQAASEVGAQMIRS